jgi:transcription elongation GreA/GreB family factor
MRNQSNVALEAMFVRDDLREAAGLTATDGELTPKNIWAQETRFASFMESLPAAKQRRALETFKDSNPQWPDVVRAALNAASAKLAGEIAGLLIDNGKVELLKETIAKVVNQHSAGSEMLLWLAKERTDSFADILGPEVFRAMLTAMERDQFNEKKSNRLRDYIMSDQALLVELIGSADLDVIKDLTRALQLSPVFDDMDKRSLLARIVKSYPAIQSLITGEQTRKDGYADLVQKKIPANSKEIAIARSYGDLRENHEYKAAKEMQKILMRQKSEHEAQIVRARGSDLSNPRTDVVSIGTQVRVTDLNSKASEQYVILGAWDSDPEKNVISYLAPVAQGLLNKKVGDEAELDTEGGKRRCRIEAIEAAPAEFVPAPAAEAVTA